MRTTLNYLNSQKNNPFEADIFQKDYHRGSGKHFFKRFCFKVINYSDHTVTFSNNAVLRQSDICIKIKKPPKSDNLAGKESKQAGKRQASVPEDKHKKQAP